MPGEDVSDLHERFHELSSALERAAAVQSVSIMQEEAERLGLRLENGNEVRQGRKWNLSDGGSTLTLSWRWYDQSGPFSIVPDMNVVILTLSEGDKELRRVELRFED